MTQTAGADQRSDGMIEPMKLKWHRMPTEGGGVATILLQGMIVRGWVCSRTGTAWITCLPPLGARPEDRVNVFTDGRFLGVYPSADAAMEALTAWLIRDVRAKSQPHVDI